MSKWTVPEFTTEKLRELRLNPYVKSVTSKMVYYTIAFKEEFWRRYRAGEKPVDIMKALGFKPEVLGSGRITGKATHIRQDAESGNGFHDIKRPANKKSKPESENNNNTLLNKMNKMQPEMEFIKKTILLERKAQQKK